MCIVHEWWIRVQLFTDWLLAGQHFPQWTSNFPAKNFSSIRSHWPMAGRKFGLMTFSELSIKRMSSEKKNEVEYNLFSIKLSSEKIVDQYFVLLPVMEKIAGNWENLDSSYFLCHKLAVESVVKMNTSQSTSSVRSRLVWLGPAFSVQRHRFCVCLFLRLATHLSQNPRKRSWNAKYKTCITGYFASLFSRFAFLFSLFVFCTRVGIRVKSQKISWYIFSRH